MPSLIQHLLSLDKETLSKATNHPFLSASAQGTLPQEKLKAWLGQDRLYQMAYINFIGVMLSRIHVPTGHDNSSTRPARETSRHWLAADMLIDCLTNIRWEIKMFEETAEKEGWLEDVCVEEASSQTRAYQDLFAGATAMGRSLLVGLCVLWATEACYLRSWQWSSSQVRQGLKEEEKDVMQRTFIPAWSSPEFEKFVNRIGEVVDEFGEEVEVGGWEWRECEKAWRQVLWAEEGFWPDVDK